MKSRGFGYELDVRGVLTPEAMAGVRPSGRVPRTMLLTFHYNSPVLDNMARKLGAVKCRWYRKDFSPFSLPGADIGWYVLPGVGASALVYDLENLRACGAGRFIMFGKAGFLKDPRSDFVMPSAAYIDEGTSPHYGTCKGAVLPAGPMRRKIRKIFERAGLTVSCDPVWTTDAIYRETPGRIAHFRKEGCACVDMESSALFSVCGRYGMEGVSVLYKGDYFSPRGWKYERVSLDGGSASPKSIAKLLVEGMQRIERD